MGTKEYLMGFCGLKSEKIDEMVEIIEYYYQGEGTKLHKVVDSILKKFTWITDMDYFYSLANEIFAFEILPKYSEEKGDFDGWCYSCLRRKLLTGVTALNRQKRMPYLRDRDGNIVEDEDKNPVRMSVISTDTPVGDEGSETTIGDFIASPNSVESEIFKEDYISDLKIEKYLDRLSKVQRKIVELLAADYKPAEIKEILHITQQEYEECLYMIHAYENISILL